MEGCWCVVSTQPAARSKVPLSISLCITANTANRPPSCSCTVDKSTHSINPSSDTTAYADLRSATYCRYRCAASSTTRSGAQCRCCSAVAVSLRCCSVSADPSASLCRPWIVVHLLPDLFVLDRASNNAIAHQSPCARRTPRPASCEVDAARAPPLLPCSIPSPSLVLLPRMTIRQSCRTCSLSSDEPPGSVLRELAENILFLTSSPATIDTSVQYVGLSEAAPSCDCFRDMEPVHTLTCEFSPSLALLNAPRDLPRRCNHRFFFRLPLSVAHAKLASPTTV